MYVLVAKPSPFALPGMAMISVSTTLRATREARKKSLTRLPISAEGPP